MPVLRAASARLEPSSTSAIASSRRAWSGVAAALASSRTADAAISVRTTTVIRASIPSAAIDSMSQRNGEFTNSQQLGRLVSFLSDAESTMAKGEDTMQRGRSGDTGPEVSALGLGCMGMSWAYGPAGPVESVATIQPALDAGIDQLDTGDFYGMGDNETLDRPGHPGPARCRRTLGQVRCHARPGRRHDRLRCPAGGGEEFSRLQPAATWHRPCRHLPPGASIPRCRSRIR